VSPLNLTDVVDKINSALNPDTLFRLGRRTGFVFRRRDIPPDLLATALIGSLATKDVESLADLQRGYNALTDKRVHYKPFYNQLAKPTFALFSHQVSAHLPDTLALTTPAPISHCALAAFSDILLQDGSSFAVHNGLAELFPGRFTKVSPAAVELHTTMSLYREQPLKVVLTPDSTGERAYLPLPDTLRGKLILADRGYLDILYCQRVKVSGGAIIVRGKNCLNPTVRRCFVSGTEYPELAGKKLNKILDVLRDCHADIDVDWTKKGETIRLRLVMYWDPSHRTHMYLVNNLVREDFDIEAVRALYRLRWQIELLFKEWKSYANLHRFQTEKAPIVEGLIWASLAAATIKRFFAQATQLLCEVEISTRIAAMSLMTHLTTVLTAVIERIPLRASVSALILYLANNAKRAHPKRDKKTGRTRFGIINLPQLC